MNIQPHKRNPRERGYILLTLMLFVALLMIGMVAIVQNIETEIKRDREEELIHRGVQYSRAVRHFFAKFKRYPGSIEELESTNNIRFLRKRYKDPITGKDFKLLYFNDVAAFDRPAGVAVPSPDVPGGSRNTVEESEASTADPVTGAQSAISGQEAASAHPGPGDQADAPRADPSGNEASEVGSDSKNDPVLRGGAIVGVASLSHAKTIREFNKKAHYNEWQFIFNPSNDSGGLISTPDQPFLRGAAVPVSTSRNQTVASNQTQSDASADSSPQIPELK
jgi:type II secretory pathway pseudopilin PulG